MEIVPLRGHHPKQRFEFPLSSPTHGISLTNTVEHHVATHWLAAPWAPKIFMSAVSWSSIMSRVYSTEVLQTVLLLARLQRSTSNLR